MEKTCKLLYQATIGCEESTERMTWLGNGQVGIVHPTGYHDDLIVVNVATGEELWRQKRYETFGGVSVPFCDERAMYIPLRENSQKLSANDIKTGEQLWTRSVGNGQYGFMVPPVQTEAHIAICNTNSSKLTVVDKKNGKVVCTAKTPHPLGDYWPMLRATRDKFITLATDKKARQYTIDLYDPAVEGCFVKTIARYPNKGEREEILNQIVIDDALYFFTDKGYFCKLDLISGEIVNRLRLPDEQYEYSYVGRYLHCYDGRLCVIASQYDGARGWNQYYAVTYSLTSGELSSTVFEGKSAMVQFYKDSAWWLSDKGLIRFAILGDGSIDCIEPEGWKNNISDRTFQNSSDSGNCWLIADDKLLAMPKSESTPIYTAGVLYCWDLSDCFKD